MSQITTSERGSRIGRRQTHSTNWPPVPEVAPEHRPRREAAAVGVQLVAASPAPFEVGHERVDQAFRLAQLGRRHPVELAVAQHLALAVGVGRDDDALERRLIAGVVAVGRDRDPALVRGLARAELAFLGRRAAGLLAIGLGRGVRVGHRGRVERAGHARGASPPPAVEDRVVDLAVVAPAGEDGRAGAAHLFAVADVDEGQGPGEVDRGAEVDREPRGAQRPPEADRLAEQPAPVDLGPPGRLHDHGVAACLHDVSRPRRPRSASGGPGRRAPGGCPPRT